MIFPQSHAEVIAIKIKKISEDIIEILGKTYYTEEYIKEMMYKKPLLLYLKSRFYIPKNLRKRNTEDFLGLKILVNAKAKH